MRSTRLDFLIRGIYFKTYQEKLLTWKTGYVYIFIDRDKDASAIENSKYQQNNSSGL